MPEDPQKGPQDAQDCPAPTEESRVDMTAVPRYDTRVPRYDQGGLLPPRLRADGSLLVDGVVTAPGVYPYWDAAEGRVVWELKPPEEFATPEFALKLNALTITDQHPDPESHPAGVKTDSFGALAVGVTMPDAQVLADGRTRVSGVVMRQDGIDSVQGGRTSWSLGAMVDIDNTPGEYQGKRYDRVQRNPQPNHLAFVDTPRVAGAGVRVDSLEVEALAVMRAHRLDGKGGCMITHIAADQTTTEGNVKVIRIDGIDVPEPIAEQVQTALDKRDEAAKVQQARADAATAEGEKLRGELEVAQKRADDAEKALTEAGPAWLTEYDQARPVADHLGVQLKGDAGSVRPLGDVRRDCLAKHLASEIWKDSAERSDEAVRGAFEALAHRVTSRDDHLHTEHAPRTDSPAGAYERARQNYHLALTGQL